MAKSKEEYLKKYLSAPQSTPSDTIQPKKKKKKTQKEGAIKIIDADITVQPKLEEDGEGKQKTV